MNPTIALVTMTKNGAKRLPNLFKSVFNFCDKAVILDTGSTDGTQKWLDEQEELPFELFEEPFVDFQVSRNRLMTLAHRSADWLLLLDDDMGLHFETPPEKIKESLNPTVGAYMLKHAPNPEYWVSRLVRGERCWTFKGVTHEYLEGGGVGNPRLNGLRIWHHFNHGPEKFNRDLKLLSADIARDPNDVRTIFYLAETLKNMGHTEAAIRYYCMRANMGGWAEEVYQAMYEAARLAKDPKGMIKAHAARPVRAEAAAWLSGYYKFVEPDKEKHVIWETVRSNIPYPEHDVLFVIPFCYGPDFVSRLENYQ